MYDMHQNSVCSFFIFDDISLQLVCVTLTVQWTTLAMKMEDVPVTVMLLVKNAINVQKDTQPSQLVIPV